MQNPKGGCEGCGVGIVGQANIEESGGGDPALLLSRCGVLLPLFQHYWHPRNDRHLPDCAGNYVCDIILALVSPQVLVQQG